MTTSDDVYEGKMGAFWSLRIATVAEQKAAADAERTERERCIRFLRRMSEDPYAPPTYRLAFKLAADGIENGRHRDE